MGLDDAIGRRQQANELRQRADAVSKAQWLASEREWERVHQALNAALSALGVDFVPRVARIADPLPLGYWVRSKGPFGGHRPQRWVSLGASGWYIYPHGFAVLTNGRFVGACGTTSERKSNTVFYSTSITGDSHQPGARRIVTGYPSGSGPGEGFDRSEFEASFRRDRKLEDLSAMCKMDATGRPLFGRPPRLMEDILVEYLADLTV